MARVVSGWWAPSAWHGCSSGFATSGTTPRTTPKMTQQEGDELPPYQTGLQRDQGPGHLATAAAPRAPCDRDRLLLWLVALVYLTWIPTCLVDERPGAGQVRAVHHVGGRRRSGRRLGVRSGLRRPAPSYRQPPLGAPVTICLAWPSSPSRAVQLGAVGNPDGHAAARRHRQRSDEHRFRHRGVLSPFTFGSLIDQTGHWQVPFGVSAALLSIGALLTLRVKPRPIGIDPEHADGITVSEPGPTEVSRSARGRVPQSRYGRGRPDGSPACTPC